MAIKNILYAEDNPDDVIILSIAFRRAKIPAALKCVDDGEDAIAWLKGDGVYSDREKYPLPDALLLDLKDAEKIRIRRAGMAARSRQFQSFAGDCFEFLG